MLTNPLLKQIDDKLNAAIPAEIKPAVERIYLAGMKLAFSKETSQNLLPDLMKSNNKIVDVGKGVVGILLMMHQQSQGTMPPDAMVAAGMKLVLEGLDFLEQMGVEQIDKSEIDLATETFIETISPKVGLTEEKMIELNAKAQQTLDDPRLAAQLKGGKNGRV